VIAAVVPQGVDPGSAFQVEFPKVGIPTDAAPSQAVPTTEPESSCENHRVMVTVPLGCVPGQTLNVAAQDGSGRLVAATIPQGMQPGSTFCVEFPSDVPSSAFVADADCHRLGDGAMPATIPSAPSNASSPESGESMVLVRVPPGTEAGTTLHVRIPGEDRMVAAVVPPDVNEFYVKYQL